MLATRLKNRELLNLALVVLIIIAFTTFSLTIDFIETLYQYFTVYNTLHINEFIINIVFLWLSNFVDNLPSLERSKRKAGRTGKLWIASVEEK